MAKTPPFDLDPHLAIRDPKALPAIMISAMYDILQRRQHPGMLVDRFIAAFNVAAWSLTTAGRKKTKHGGWHGEGSEARLRKGTLELTPIIGVHKNVEAKKARDYDRKERWIFEAAKRILESNPDRYAKTWQEAQRG